MNVSSLQFSDLVAPDSPQPPEKFSLQFSDLVAPDSPQPPEKSSFKSLVELMYSRVVFVYILS